MNMRIGVVVALMMVMPFTASAQTISDKEILAQIEKLTALVLVLQKQLAEQIAQERAHDDAEDACEEATELLEDADSELAEYEAETERLRDAVRGDYRTVYRLRDGITAKRNEGYQELFDKQVAASEQVANECN